MDENTLDDVVSLSKKVTANRRNARLSTGPRTEEGKSRSRRNSLKHGILAPALLITEGEGAEDPDEFDGLLGRLRRDLAPVGTLEEMLVEKIAVSCWRQRRALRCEAGSVRRAFLQLHFETNLERASIKDHLSLPLDGDLHRLLRYETTIHRQLAYAINQLERLQRARKGEHVPAPVSVQVSGDE
jgi:hypothetical protein